MSRPYQRIAQVVQAMSPEDKARWVIEAPLLGQEISDAEEQAMLAKMKPEEGRRYNAYLARWNRLRHNLLALAVMITEIKMKLLERDRILWYLHAAHRPGGQYPSWLTVHHPPAFR